MEKKTKLIIGGLGILALIFAYKKGLFGGKKSDAPADAPSGDIIDNRAKYVAPDKPTQASTPPADKPSNAPSGGAPVASPPPPPPVEVNVDPSGGANPMNWLNMKPASF